jgi:hypothetical protein
MAFTFKLELAGPDAGRPADVLKFDADVAVPDWLMTDVAETCPREDRTPERQVFPGFTVDAARMHLPASVRM